MGNLVLQVASGLAEGAAESRAMSFKAAEARTAARQGKIAAAQTDTAVREELANVISNIRSIRASSGISPDSPTTRAIIEKEGGIAERERRIRVGNILAQVSSDTRSARFFSQSADSAWLYGGLKGVTAAFTTASQQAAGAA
jgi:hypothetical protein